MIGELTNHLWQSTLFAAAAGLLTVAFRKNRAQVRFWLWFSSSIKFFIPFSLLMSVGSHLELAPAADKIVAAPFSVAMVEIAEPFPVSSPHSPATQSARDWVAIAIIAGWACGFAAVASIRMRGWLRIRDAVRASKPIAIPATVEIRSAPGLLEPGVVGVWKPVLLVPKDLPRNLTPQQLEAVIAHELCHVRRRDNLFAAIHMIAEALFWFHPVVWWIGARLVEERERACDEEVLSLGSEPRVYAEGILNVCKLYVESPLACVSGVTGANLKKRIAAIMTNRRPLILARGKRVALMAAGMAALAAPIVVGIINSPTLRARPQRSLAPSARGTTAKFEVASVKPCTDRDLPPGGRKGGRDLSPGRLHEDCRTLKDFIQMAYVLFANGHVNLPGRGAVPIEGGPVWIDSDHYRIDAKAENPQGQGTMHGPMLQALLEKRFKLKIHREIKEVPVYALTVAKGGLKVQQFKKGSCNPIDWQIFTQFPPPPLPELPAGQKYCPSLGTMNGPNVTVEAQGTSVDDFSRLFLGRLDRPVINKTGIEGLFNFHLEYAPEETTALGHPDGGEPRESYGPSIFTAIQQQLGLKLEPAKGPGHLLVIDHAEKPSGN